VNDRSNRKNSSNIPNQPAGERDGTGSTSVTLGRLEDGSERACCEESAIDDLRPDPERIASEEAVFKALANEKRLAVVHALRDGELCACDLEAVLDAPQSTVATHLRKLRDAGIVRTRKDGKWTHYRIADTASLQLVDLAAALGGES
jgi:ArsR family transcriptional regulator